MIGALAGDIIGSVYEWHNIKTTEFPLFSPASRYTDDSILTVALADSILNGTDYINKMKEYYKHYSQAGFGSHFINWALSDSRQPYHSWGNGAAMRISPAGFAYKTLEETLQKAEYFTATTHNHPEGIRGGCATAAAVFLARKGHSKTEIKDYIESTFQYNQSRTLEEIRPTYQCDISCQGTVPEAMIAFMESSDFEDAIRKAVSLGGDSDTLACITGGIAEAFYGGIPDSIASEVSDILDKPLLKITREFDVLYCSGTFKK